LTCLIGFGPCRKERATPPFLPDILFTRCIFRFLLPRRLLPALALYQV
jgi:hypothetical protein